jgi:N-acetylglucosaminyl-diphospho-decaprenol L-rhamnosyltransferase
MTLKHVAVIIITYKTAQLTIDCLRSIAAQRDLQQAQITVTVVDNSFDDFAPIKMVIESNNWSNWVQLACPPKNGGFAYGNNFGVKLACSNANPDYIHLLNPDTVVREGAIVSLVRFLEEHECVGIAGSSFENLDGSDWPFAFRFPTILSEIEEGLQLGFVSKLLRRWRVAQTMGKAPERIDWVPGASMLIRKSVFDAVGGLDEGYFLYFEETDFCFRANKLGFATWYVPQSRVMHIAGQSTKVTERNVEGRRLPSYWFESRRRFFLLAYGLYYAIATDVVTVIARGLGATKRFLFRHGTAGTPHFISDLLRYSVIRTKNRNIFPSI